MRNIISPNSLQLRILTTIYFQRFKLFFLEKVCKYLIINAIPKSGKRDSNSRPSAWEANALPTELLPQDLIITLKLFTQHKSRYSDSNRGPIHYE